MSRILIVDDALFMRKLLGDILKNAGHEVVGEGQSAKEAVDLYKTLKPDFITLDVVMPEVDGMTTIKAINAIKSFDRKAKIIMVSAMGQQQVIAEMIDAGARDFIVKPFDKVNVINAVQKLIDK